MELEKQVKMLKESMICEKCGGSAGLGAGSDKGSQVVEGLPRQPEKFTFMGHKLRITKVTLHPIYSIVATASEDATIKFWDYEQGELE